MNNFEFWRQFSAFVELIFGREGGAQQGQTVDPWAIDGQTQILEKSRGQYVSLSPSPGYEKFKIVHITKSA